MTNTDSNAYQPFDRDAALSNLMTELVACIGVILTEPNQNPPTVLAIENYASIVGLVDTYADAVAADAVRNHNPWRPIETAPKSNGSKTFLVYITGHGSCVAFRGEDGRIYNASKGFMGEIFKPTHWKHLDAPPIQRTEETE